MIYLRQANARGHADHGWLNTYHTFSFANYYDPNFLGYSTLRVINEDRVEAGQGFGEHSHKDMEILSYVLSGTLEHRDSMGNKEYIKQGEFQIMSAGTGIRHSEYNPSVLDLLHFYQIWIIPERENLKPRYETKAFPHKMGKQLILSPNAKEDSLVVFQNMQLWRWRFEENEKHSYCLPAHYKHIWIQVVTGKIMVNDVFASASDGVAIRGEESVIIETQQASEILLFELP